MAPKQELQNNDIGELWKRYKPLEGRDDHADLILALIRKLIIQAARDIAYGSWRERLSHPPRIISEQDLTQAMNRVQEHLKKEAEPQGCAAQTRNGLMWTFENLNRTLTKEHFSRVGAT